MKKEDEKLILSHVEETGLLTLYCKAIESLADQPIIYDRKAIEIAEKLDPYMAESERKMLRNLAARKLDQRLVVHIALRAKKYDQYALRFLEAHPKGVVVNIGCGMDPRFFRIDNGKLTYFDLDLPEMIAFKKKFLNEARRYKMIAGSVFDYQWMDQVKKAGAGQVMFLAEGVFMYFQPDRVKKLVLEMQKRFPGSELVCEVVKKQWTKGVLAKMAAAKMSNRINMGEDAGFLFGLDHGEEMEEWHPDIRYIDQWSYFETNHEKLGWMRMFRHSKYFREMQYTVHYKLG